MRAATPGDKKIYESIAGDYFNEFPLDPQKLNGVARMTVEKAADICTREGYEVTGFVLSNTQGPRCVVEMSAVRWLDLDEMWKLMHPEQG